ncbi:MAG: hypothetical protein FGM42_01290 [Ilumatobacteraceae bacterium]|nr:hypothetical protein [Ilumatobacteraceae bacterium]
MKRKLSSSTRHRAGLLVVGLVASAGAISAVAPTPVSASTEIGVVVAPEFGLDKVVTKLHIIDTVGIVSRLPEVKATEDEARAMNAKLPTVTCKGSAGAVTPTAEYASDGGALTIIVVFDSVPSIESCTLSNSTYVQASGDTVYPISDAAKAALWGDPAKELAAANTRLRGAVPALRTAFADYRKSTDRGTYRGAWSRNAAARVDKTLKAYTVKSADLDFDAVDTSSKVMYLIRPVFPGARWVDLCQRLKDGRLPCLRFNPLSAKTKLWMSNQSAVQFTSQPTEETAVQ